MTHFVYPGATHSRFQHAIGAMHLMEMAIAVIRAKKQPITPEEEEAALIAILLHDIGHGPFSHALESSIIPRITHEDMSALLMQELNSQFEGRLAMAMEIFADRYHKRFLHQLVAGQLDMDRLDYLKRDSFYTGVTEGVIGSDRIIKMLNVKEDQLVIEAKGIYSIEKFLIARRLMYWQVYLHKAVVAAEHLLTMVLKCARRLILKGEKLFAPPALQFFLQHGPDQSVRALIPGTAESEQIIANFINLDDDDIMTAAKVWSEHADRTLSLLSRWLTGRTLYRVVFADRPFPVKRTEALKELTCREYGIPAGDTEYFVFTGEISNYAYRYEDEKIRILYNNGELKDIADASDMLNVSVLSKTVRKHFLCYPKILETQV